VQAVTIKTQASARLTARSFLTPAKTFGFFIITPISR
jgi:hypothetical protein